MPKLVVLDIDGVVFRSHLIIEMARRLGLCPLVRAWLWATAFNQGRLGVRDLVERAYGQLRGATRQALWSVYRAMALAPGARETVEELRRRGDRVILLSSGVPDPIVHDLVSRLRADDGAGIELGFDGDDRLTGEVRGALLKREGKVEHVQALIRRLGLDWADVVAVGDDPGNLPLMERAGRSIGANARGAVRKRADWLVDGGDLRAIVPAIDAERRRGPSVPPNEVRRRLVHATAIIWPFLAEASHHGAALLLGAVAALYAVSEWLRLNGARLPPFTAVTLRAVRPAEARRFALAPLTLSAGVAASLYFPDPIPYIAVGIVGIGDTAASLVGQRFGRIPLPHNRKKTLEGSAAAFAVCVAWGLPFLPPGAAAVVAGAAVLAESLPLEDWDNLLMPLVAAGAALLLA